MSVPPLRCGKCGSVLINGNTAYTRDEKSWYCCLMCMPNANSSYLRTVDYSKIFPQAMGVPNPNHLIHCDSGWIAATKTNPHHLIHCEVCGRGIGDKFIAYTADEKKWFCSMACLPSVAGINIRQVDYSQLFPGVTVVPASTTQPTPTKHSGWWGPAPLSTKPPIVRPPVMVESILDPSFPEPEYETYEIGAYGKPHHDPRNHEFLDETRDGLRRIKVTDGPFVVKSCGIIIYIWDPDQGGRWFGTELYRRRQEGLPVKEEAP